MASLGMMSVLLLITAPTGLISNGYQKVYGVKFSVLKITLSGFPHQTSESVTNIGLPGCVQTPGRNTIGCHSSSNVVIPGIGEGRVSATFDAIIQQIATPGPMIVSVVVVISGLPGQTVPSLIQSTGGCPSCPPFHVTDRINIHGIGPGQATVQVS
ncbi:MAG TPA: hypothetical protein VEL11_07510 [Candidatus Bathyarchaeia archaeon]|nr:hypothetical protein [Candidatus Bathyarchaeia archaeon]